MISRVLARPLLPLDLFQGTQLSAKKELPRYVAVLFHHKDPHILIHFCLIRVCQNAQWEVLLYTLRALASVL